MSASQADAGTGALRMLPYMGVIYVVAEAEKLGFYNGHPDWCNLGQGQPEVGEMAGAPPRLGELRLAAEDHAYGPIHGTLELRQRVADHYNRLYRRGMKSQYTAENVAIASGGRLALTRSIFSLGSVNVGYQLPDYTAYEDMLGAQMHRVTPIPLATTEADGFMVPAARFEKVARNAGLTAMLISNPCNPTGRVLRGGELAAWVGTARKAKCTLLLDEFYSHFIYEADGSPAREPVSAAAYVEDVDQDPALLFDGLTKNFRYPGWRLGWVVGPKAMIKCMITAGSSVDGGPSRLAQRAALEVLAPARADQETTALRQVFSEKRNAMVRALTEIGVRLPFPPESTFYAWGCLDRLPRSLADGQSFFRAALAQQVMTVPGEFFDVNPGKHRQGQSPYAQWMRFSFGPPMPNLTKGLTRLATMVKAAG
jgi:aspartate/methionine/tyrosine aminotransferase